jgi:2-phospho-L-lactate guanylyltransferase
LGDSLNDSVMAIVPMKPLAEAKRRLAEVLEEAARVNLSRGLLIRTLGVLTRARGITRLCVVSRDEQVLKIARSHGAWATYETGHGLNEALEQATRAAKSNGVPAVLIVPADLPTLAESDVERIIELGRNPPCVVIAPARRDHGTNALLVNPSGLINYAFGEMSFVEHRRFAEQAGARVEIFRSDGVAFDVDLPEDVKALAEWDLHAEPSRDI